MIYVARALRESNVGVEVYSLQRDEFYETALRELDLHPTWVGRRNHPLLRLGAFVAALRSYKPHIIQAGHSFANLYVALAARLLGAVGIGTIRSDVRYEIEMELEYRFEGLANAVLGTYWQIADQRRDGRVLAALAATSGAR